MVQTVRNPQTIKQTNISTVKVSPLKTETVVQLHDHWKTMSNEVAKLIAQAWMDEAFKARFVAQPMPFLQEAGINLPEGVEVKIVEGLDEPWKIEFSADTQQMTYLINLPPKPEDMISEDLNMAVADRTGKFCNTCYCC